MFTSQEIDILLEALDVWEKEPGSGAVLSGLMGAMLAPDKGEAENFIKEEADKAKYKTRQRKRQAILLKAKLVQMADEATAEELFNGG